MKQQEKSRLTRKVTVRFTEEEYKKIISSFESTTKRKLSGYIRSVLLHKPITVYTRNQSFDDFVSEMMQLRTELKAIGNNFNQTVKKLHTLDKDPEIKTWAMLNENSKEIFFKKVDTISLKIIEISNQWSQE